MDTVNTQLNFQNKNNSIVKDKNNTINTTAMKMQLKLHYHKQEEVDAILDYLHINNELQTNLCVHLDKISHQNQIIFTKIMDLFGHVYTSFDILFNNSVLCSKITNDTSYYIIYDEKLKDNYNSIKNYTNNYNINLLTNIINNLFNTNKELYFTNCETYVKSIQNTILYSNEGNIQLIHKFIDIVTSFDITDSILNMFTPIYMEIIKIYQFAHKIITDAAKNQLHFIAKTTQDLILAELQKARLLIPDIKKEIDGFTELIPGMKPFITSYIDNCNKILENYI
jgi:hypothetical protein